MALSAGLHRLTNRPGDEEQRHKRITFWLIYSMDRSLALRLGRVPNIQDYDIQTARLSFPSDIDSPMGHLLGCWIDVGELQGQIYHQLYSAHAQAQAPEAKARAAEQLATRCLEIYGNVILVGELPRDKYSQYLSGDSRSSRFPIPRSNLSRRSEPRKLDFSLF